MKKVTLTFEQKQENGQNIQIITTLFSTRDGGTTMQNEFKPSLKDLKENAETKTEVFAFFNIFLEALRINLGSTSIDENTIHVFE